MSLRETAERLVEAETVVALTGAGASADSGIPTFRGKDGLWNKYDPRELATSEAFARDPERVWEWYLWRRRKIAEAEPNPTHTVLALMERDGLLEAVITQNVDGLHQRAGSRRVIELHGNIWRDECVSCEYQRVNDPERGEGLEYDELPPKCPDCGDPLRPGVVWFGEPLPHDALVEAENLARSCDVMLVIGTSGEVRPAADLPLVAKSCGATLIEISPSETALSSHMDVIIRERAASAMEALWGEIERLS
ncbi:SIR2 family NAD-dependent protein deacylase [Methanopyrus sp.]